MSKLPPLPPAPTASAIGPCLSIIQIVGCPGTGSLPRIIALPRDLQIWKDSCNRLLIYE